MRFCFTVYADNQVELGDALDAVRDVLPHNLFEKHGRGFMIDVLPDSFPALVPDAVPAPAPEAVPTETRRRRPKADAEPAAPRDDPPEASPFEPEPEPEPAPTLTPAEAKHKALDLLRDAFGREGGPPHVKALQTEYGVKKFAEVPDAKGHELLARAEALTATLPTAAA